MNINSFIALTCRDKKLDEIKEETIQLIRIRNW